MAPAGCGTGTGIQGRAVTSKASTTPIHFDEDLQREWRWTERWAAQPEILAYLEHVADRFDLRRSYRFDTRVTSAVWDDDAKRWAVGADDGTITTARFFINATGSFAGYQEERFSRTGRFPRNGPAHQPMARRWSRPGRQARRCGRHWLDGRSGHPNHRFAG